METLEPLAEKLMTSADSRLAAASKEIRVRVESSKKRLTTVRPRRVGSFLIGRSASSRQLLGGVEDQEGVVAGQVGRGDQVALHFSSSFTAGRASRPSSSPRADLTVSGMEVGRFLPT